MKHVAELKKEGTATLYACETGRTQSSQGNNLCVLDSHGISLSLSISSSLSLYLVSTYGHLMCAVEGMLCSLMQKVKDFDSKIASMICACFGGLWVSEAILVRLPNFPCILAFGKCIMADVLFGRLLKDVIE